MAKVPAAWQRSMLPLMVVALVLGAVCFAVVSIQEFYSFREGIALNKQDKLSEIFDKFEKANPRTASDIEFLQLKSRTLLEELIIDRRYNQANTTVLARAWTRFMGFTTGMVLAIVGASFVLGKLQEAQTKIKQDTNIVKFSLETSSPGIVLAALGTFLMSITLLARFEIDVRDTPIYVAPHTTTPAPSLPDPSTLLRPERPTSPSDKDARENKSSTDPRLGGVP